MHLFVNDGQLLIDGIDDTNGFDGCERLFDQSTSSLLSEYSECEWDFVNQMITILLSSHSTIDITDSLLLRSHVLVVKNDNQITSNEDQIVIDEILVDEMPVTPIVLLHNFNQEIGLCDDLTLDARNSYHLGLLYHFHSAFSFVYFMTFFFCFRFDLYVIRRVGPHGWLIFTIYVNMQQVHEHQYLSGWWVERNIVESLYPFQVECYLLEQL